MPSNHEKNRACSDSEKGFLRTNLAGSGHTLMEAFANLRESPLVTLTENLNRQLLGARQILDPSEGEGHWDFYQLGDSVYVVVCEFVYLHSHSERIPGEGLLEFHISLSGSRDLELSQPEPLHLDGPSLLIWNQPEGFDSEVSTAPGDHEKALSLYCKPSFIRDNIIVDSSRIPALLKGLLSDDQQSINFCKVPLSIDIVNTANSLYEIDHQEPLGLLLMEAKVLELLYLILTSFDNLAQGEDESYSGNDLQSFREAHQIISEQHCPPPTITQIAGMVGINKSKLTQGFKSVFGLTLFEFATQCRMQTALKLLQESDKQVGLISDMLGYEHQTTFTAAFKKYFDFLPKDARKLKKPPV